MDRLRLKEHIVTTLKSAYGDKYPITGDYPEDIKAIAIVVSMQQEDQLLGKGSGRLSYDDITGKERTLYVTSISMGIAVYSPIDEEAMAIAGDIQDAFRRKKNVFISSTCGITSVNDISGISSPAMISDGKKKIWVARLGFNVTVTETVETE